MKAALDYIAVWMWAMASLIITSVVFRGYMPWVEIIAAAFWGGVMLLAHAWITRKERK